MEFGGSIVRTQKTFVLLAYRERISESLLVKLSLAIQTLVWATRGGILILAGQTEFNFQNAEKHLSRQMDSSIKHYTLVALSHIAGVNKSLGHFSLSQILSYQN